MRFLNIYGFYIGIKKVFNRLKYYKQYYTNLSPNDFKVQITDKSIVISNIENNFAKGGDIKRGNCYEMSGKIAMGKSYGYDVPEIDFYGTPYVVHAQVEGQARIEGLKYGHSWIEDDLFVYDYSNGNELIIPKKQYYNLGNVKMVEPLYFKYTFKEALRKMVDTGHYGSWDLKTESGL